MKRIPLRASVFVAVVASLALCSACEPPVPQTVSVGVPGVTVIQESAVDPVKAQVMLPAYETAAERALSVKSDAASDFRKANKQWFAATQPPEAGRFRAFQEWETMKEVWMTYAAGTSSNPPVRRLFAEQTIAFVRDSNPKMKAKVIVPAASSATAFLSAMKEFGASDAELAAVEFIAVPNQTIWHIDYSPFPLVDKAANTLAFTDFVYYGERYLDDAIPTRLATQYYKDITTYRMPFEFEGGNIQADGMGSCATTERALQNTGYSALKVRNLLKKYIACDKAFIVKDITDDGTGHIDMFFKWIDVDHVLFGEYNDSIALDYNGDGTVDTIPIPGAKNAAYKLTFAKNKQRMEDNVALFAATTAPNGKKYTVSRLTMMTWYKDSYGDLPRTFINSTFANGVNAYPSYAEGSCQSPTGTTCMTDGDCCTNFSDCNKHCASGKCTTGPTAEGCDELLPCGSGLKCVKDPLKVALRAKAQQQWQAAMPTWKHVGLRADVTATWSGAIHCITRTIPNLPGSKAIADGYCVQGKCGCVTEGTQQACATSAECSGPAWQCDCNICSGTCAGGKACTDDADCSTDGTTVVKGSCSINPAQGCYGTAGAGGDPCQGVSYEGVCNGKQLLYCDQTLQQQNCGATECCGWDAASGFYNCLPAAQCKACVAECQVNTLGCSAEATHTWTCASVGGCLVRQYSPCAAGCDTKTGSCKSSSGTQWLDKCPADPGPDAGPTDTADAADTSDTNPPQDVPADLPPADTNPPLDVQPDLPPADTNPPQDVQPDVPPQDTQADVQPPDTLPPQDTAPDGPCQPNCFGRQCGPNGCGGNCGYCLPGLDCDDSIGKCKIAEQTDTNPTPDDTATRTDTRSPTDSDPRTQDGIQSDTNQGTTPVYSAQPSNSSGCSTSTRPGSGASGAAWLGLALVAVVVQLRRRRSC
jgi:MYXO-CTERM domain-containing protein